MIVPLQTPPSNDSHCSDPSKKQFLQVSNRKLRSNVKLEYVHSESPEISIIRRVG